MIKIFGIRAAESVRRKANWKLWQPHRNGQGWILNPILYWSDDDVWEYTRDNHVPYCSLYDEGWMRLGCVGCPMAGDGRRKEFAWWPKYEQAWKRAFKTMYDRLHDLPRNDGKPRFWARFDSWQEMWQWWMEELPEPTEDDGCQMGLF